MMDILLRFSLASLAVWRMTHLLAYEDGPFDLIVRSRAWLGQGMLGRLMDCFLCLSLWVAAPFAIWVASWWDERVITWLALSGVACLLERLGQQPLRLEAKVEGARDGVVLRRQEAELGEGEASDREGSK